MATMNEDIDDLGAVGIVREAFKIFRTYAKVFLLIQLTVLVDVVALITVGQFLFWRKSWHPPGPADNLHSRTLAAFGVPSPIIDAVTLLLYTALFGLVANAALSLSLSATLYTVALHYAGHAVSFVGVIRASVPRLWMRLAVTSTYNLLILYVIVLVETAASLVFLYQSNGLSVWLILFSQVVVLSSTVLSFGISTIFTVAEGVSVFEEDYGWAAVTKALKLLKGKVKVAIFLQLLLILPGIIQLLLKYGFEYEIRQADSGVWNYLIRTVIGAAYIVWVSFVAQLVSLCYGVQYVSFKAYHTSVSITDSIRAENAVYERVANGAAEPLLRGQETDGKV